MTCPMTFGNMRANGVRSLIVWCSNVNCRHEAIVNVDSQANVRYAPNTDRFLGRSEMTLSATSELSAWQILRCSNKSRLLEINRPYLYIWPVAPARPALAHHFIASTSSRRPFTPADATVSNGESNAASSSPSNRGYAEGAPQCALYRT